MKTRHPWLHGQLYSAEDDLTPEEMTRVAIAAAEALQGAQRAAQQLGAEWALIGGQALIAYGVPRITTDVDILAELAGEIALALVTGGWTALQFDLGTGDYTVTSEVTAHYMDDPVLFDIGAQRIMFPIRSPGGMIVELLTAQHPIETEMVELAMPRKVYGAQIPVAPLGGVLLVKVKADRPKDRAAVEQAADLRGERGRRRASLTPDGPHGRGTHAHRPGRRPARAGALGARPSGNRPTGRLAAVRGVDSRSDRHLR